MGNIPHHLLGLFTPAPSASKSGVRRLSQRRFKICQSSVISNPPRKPIENLDEIPIPSHDLLPMKKYKSGKVDFATIVTSRGSPFNCIFCSSSLQFGKKWRVHSVERAYFR
ncbi:MAG: hypothetical protein QW566_10045 [Candidatus Jordarchaeales archaeon]